MKKAILIVTLFIVVFILSFPNKAHAWENKLTHPTITQRAIDSSTCVLDSYLKTEFGLGNGINTELEWTLADMSNYPEFKIIDPGISTRTILDWIKAGSIVEDEDGKIPKPWRPRHHFHDPTRNAGLDNLTDHPLWTGITYLVGWVPRGESALSWVTVGTSSQWVPLENVNTWDSARESFYDALTEQDKTWREGKLTATFLSLGKILHLLEDMGVPAHVRNDFLYGHYRNALNNGNPLEGWVEKETAKVPVNKRSLTRAAQILRFTNAAVALNFGIIDNEGGNPPRLAVGHPIEAVLKDFDGYTLKLV